MWFMMYLVFSWYIFYSYRGFVVEGLLDFKGFRVVVSCLKKGIKVWLWCMWCLFFILEFVII